MTAHVQPTGAVAGYRPERTLRLSVELRRQFKRRRTLGVLIGALKLRLLENEEPALPAGVMQHSWSRISSVALGRRA